MTLSGKGKLLRIFLGERDLYRHRPLYEMIITTAKSSGLAGATVLRGVAGFGAASRIIHTAKIERLSEDLPIVVEIADEEKRIQEFLPTLDAMLTESGCGGLVTLEETEVIAYRHGK